MQVLCRWSSVDSVHYDLSGKEVIVDPKITEEFVILTRWAITNRQTSVSRWLRLCATGSLGSNLRFALWVYRHVRRDWFECLRWTRHDHVRCARDNKNQIMQQWWLVCSADIVASCVSSSWLSHHIQHCHDKSNVGTQVDPTIRVRGLGLYCPLHNRDCHGLMPWGIMVCYHADGLWGEVELLAEWLP